MHIQFNADTSSSCGSAVIQGPLDEQGNPPNGHKMLTIQATSHNHVNVTCQLNIASGEPFNGYNPRLRIYFTCDAQVCVLLSQNGSHAQLGEECEGITYRYYEKRENGVMNFMYSIPWIDRLENSVITCGILYHPHGNITQCFKDSAGLVTLKENLTCSLPETTTESTTRGYTIPTTTRAPHIASTTCTNQISESTNIICSTTLPLPLVVLVLILITLIMLFIRIDRFSTRSYDKALLFRQEEEYYFEQKKETKDPEKECENLSESVSIPLNDKLPDTISSREPP